MLRYIWSDVGLPDIKDTWCNDKVMPCPVWLVLSTVNTIVDKVWYVSPIIVKEAHINGNDGHYDYGATDEEDENDSAKPRPPV